MLPVFLLPAGGTGFGDKLPLFFLSISPQCRWKRM
jgi:hypothetical protein